MNPATLNQYETRVQIINAIRTHFRLLGHKGYGVTELRTFDPVPIGDSV
jgi:hypothetical protein